MLEIYVKKYNELTIDELYSLLQLRSDRINKIIPIN